MIEGYLEAILVLLILIALCVALYPLRHNKIGVCCLAPLMAGLLWLAYAHWGAFDKWVHYTQQQQKQGQVRAMLASAGGTDALIQQIKTRLDNTPASAHGWYLIGKLYLSQQKTIKAKKAFAVAHRLDPEDEAIILHYAQAVWDSNSQSFDKDTRGLLKAILKKNPNQPDALAMLALDAFRRKHHEQAIAYWERLLTHVAPQSEEAAAIRQAIATARQKSES